MSDNSHSYQTEVPREDVNTHDAVSNAFDEKLIEQSKGLNSNDIEAEQARQAEQDSQDSEEQSDKNDEFSSKFAALSRKERQMREREQEFQRKVQEFEARMQAMQQPKEEEVKEPELPLEYQLKKNPIETLEKLGLTYEELTQMILNDGKMSTDMQLKLMREELERDYQSKFEELNKKLIDKEKQEEEQKYEQVLNSFKSEINDFISSSEEYELIQVNEAQDLVYDVIEQYYDETGQIMDTKEAADQVEAYLEEEAQTLLEKSKKLKSRIASPSTNPVPRQSPTLSNSLSARGVESTADKPLSREESLQRLAQQIKWDD